MLKEAHRQKHQTLLLCFNCAISLIPFVHNCHSQVSHQLAMFQRHVSPAHKTLQKFPMLFWAFPVPFHMDMPSADWEGQLLTSCLFISLIQKQDLARLEVALIAWFWPEIRSNTALLDVISTSKTYTRARSRSLQLARAIVFFSALSRPHPVQTSTGLQVSEAAKMQRRRNHCKTLRRYNEDLKASRQQPQPYILLVADALGGSSQPDDLERELEREADMLVTAGWGGGNQEEGGRGEGE